MTSIPPRIKSKNHAQLCERVVELEAALDKCNKERAELDAAFTSLSQLVYENQPHLLKQAAAQAAQEKAQ